MTQKKIYLIVGMAGSGKTTFSQRLYSWISQKDYEHDKDSGLNKFIYSINLDPAALKTKMPLNEDIRDFVDHEEVMEKYNLGPNGAITTCLNLYLLQIDRLINNIQADNVIIDTPGQIEAFTWSSPGFVLVDGLKALKDYKIHILYVIDSECSQKQEVFIANMVYAASLACRYGVECNCVFNKSDLVEDTIILEWMRDYNKFRESLDQNEMSSTMTSSLALYFEEFYSHFKHCYISSSLGSGKEDFFGMVKDELPLENK